MTIAITFVPHQAARVRVSVRRAYRAQPPPHTPNRVAALCGDLVRLKRHPNDRTGLTFTAPPVRHPLSGDGTLSLLGSPPTLHGFRHRTLLRDFPFGHRP